MARQSPDQHLLQVQEVWRIHEGDGIVDGLDGWRAHQLAGDAADLAQNLGEPAGQDRRGVLVVYGRGKLKLLEQDTAHDREVIQHTEPLGGSTLGQLSDRNGGQVLAPHVFGNVPGHVTPKGVPADRVLGGDRVETGAGNPRRLNARTINVLANGAGRAFAG